MVLVLGVQTCVLIEVVTFVTVCYFVYSFDVGFRDVEFGDCVWYIQIWTFIYRFVFDFGFSSLVLVAFPFWFGVGFRCLFAVL